MRAGRDARGTPRAVVFLCQQWPAFCLCSRQRPPLISDPSAAAAWTPDLRPWKKGPSAHRTAPGGDKGGHGRATLGSPRAGSAPVFKTGSDDRVFNVALSDVSRSADWRAFTKTRSSRGSPPRQLRRPEGSERSIHERRASNKTLSFIFKHSSHGTSLGARWKKKKKKNRANYSRLERFELGMYSCISACERASFVGARGCGLFTADDVPRRRSSSSAL